MWSENALSDMAKRCRRNSKQSRPWADCSFSSSLIWVYTVFAKTDLSKNLDSLRYTSYVKLVSNIRMPPMAIKDTFI